MMENKEWLCKLLEFSLNWKLCLMIIKIKEEWKNKTFQFIFFCTWIDRFRIKWKIIGCRWDGVQPRINQEIGMGFVYGQDYTSMDAINRWCDEEGIKALNWIEGKLKWFLLKNLSEIIMRKT